jgi:hypothetical protein
MCGSCGSSKSFMKGVNRNSRLGFTPTPNNQLKLNISKRLAVQRPVIPAGTGEHVVSPAGLTAARRASEQNRRGIIMKKLGRL